MRTSRLRRLVPAFALMPLLLPGVASAQLSSRLEVAHVVVSNPPPIQMLVPGFTVRELPLELNNINNFVYAPDGRLFALCYDGNVLQLSDTDGDGLEDNATHFYKNERNEITTCIDMAWGPGGLYIPAKGRIVRLRDKGDGAAELETVVGGWRMRTNALKDFDAYGIALDPAGNIFFSLCTENMRNAYLVNTNPTDSTFGLSAYTLKDERGSVLKFTPGADRWEHFATGFRYACALEFNSHGDLFATDQEGATWLPNGNPLDELLHIQKGRHYGYPPRHPKYLPDVIDEPSTFDYGPQHQSTCNLHFNDPVANGASIFGPAFWRSDALITGESRGKIYRTKLVKTQAGYVAQNQIIACLNMLTIEAAPTSQGDLLIALHSGRPDWGTGPQGKGKLYKISYTDKTAPQPVLAYGRSPTETRVVYDRPLDPNRAQDLARRASMTLGLYVSAGDEFESFVPGYQAVRNQRQMPRYRMPVLSASLTPDNRSLILHTPPRSEAVNYAIRLPERPNRERPYNPDRKEQPQHAVTEVMTDLTGVEASWLDPQGRVQWSGWLPTFDLAVAKTLTAASYEHARLFQLIKHRGTLKLKGQLDLWYMLRAKTQPDSKLDFEYPPETVTVAFKANESVKLRSSAAQRISRQESRLVTQSEPGRWVPVEVFVATGGEATQLEVTWHTHEDSRPRALQLRRVFMPWVTPRSDILPLLARREIPELAGGDWMRGKEVFSSEQAACAKCHQVRGEGGIVGPDLSNLIFRDYASVLRDITEPSAALDPDYLAYEVSLTDGETASGVLLNHSSETISFGQATGETLRIPATNVVTMKASTLSLMPEGIFQGLSEQQQKDLLTYLLMPPPKAATSRRANNAR